MYTKEQIKEAGLKAGLQPSDIVILLNTLPHNALHECVYPVCFEESVCPKCASSNIVWTCYCNDCNKSY